MRIMPRIKIRGLFWLQLGALCCVLGFVGCSSSGLSDPYKAYRAESAAVIFNKADMSLAKGDFADAVEGLEALDAIYPFGVYAQQGQLESIYAYYQNDDDASAVAAADRYIRLYPNDSNVAYAYYMKGLILSEQGQGFLQRKFHSDQSEQDLSNKNTSFVAFSQLLLYYPHSIYAPSARLQLRYLRNLFARRELLVADYYLRRQAYVAAINRAANVIQHFQRTPSVLPALQITLKAQNKLGLRTMARHTQVILSANFPNPDSLAHNLK